MLFLTIFEFAAVVLVIVGLIYEKKLIAFEEKIGNVLGTAIGKAIRKHLEKKGK